MSKRTGIQWTGTTWNPLRGCTKVSQGCKNCYAEREAKRFSKAGIADYPQYGFRLRIVANKLEDPFSWTKPRMVFVNSMSDLFHEQVPTPFLDQVWDVMELTPWHTYQVLTKRPKRMLGYMHARRVLPNVWLGTSIETRATARYRLPLLRQTPEPASDFVGDRRR